MVAKEDSPGDEDEQRTTGIRRRPAGIEINSPGTAGQNGKSLPLTISPMTPRTKAIAELKTSEKNPVSPLTPSDDNDESHRDDDEFDYEKLPPLRSRNTEPKVAGEVGRGRTRRDDRPERGRTGSPSTRSTRKINPVDNSPRYKPYEQQHLGSAWSSIWRPGGSCGCIGTSFGTMMKWRLWGWLRLRSAYIFAVGIWGLMVALTLTGPISKVYFCEEGESKLGGTGYCDG